jgi:uncharacterized membrane protein
MNFYYDSNSNFNHSMSEGFLALFDNFYESLSNNIMNDLFGFSISYFLVNGVEFVIIGFLLLIGSVVCVNLYQINKNSKARAYTNFLTVFNFFTDFTSFFFLRKQNLTKQCTIKSSLKVFKHV